jgi:hypothetical protein
VPIDRAGGGRLGDLRAELLQPRARLHDHRERPEQPAHRQAVRRYANPSGSDSGPPNGLYFGTVSIPGASYADDENKSVNGVPA